MFKNDTMEAYVAERAPHLAAPAPFDFFGSWTA